MIRNFLMPFGYRPKRREGQRYGDVYGRAVACTIDMTIIFTMLQDFFLYLTERIFARIDPEKMNAIIQEQTIGMTLQRMWEAHVIHLWVLNFSIQMFCIGVLFVSCQCIYGTTPGKWLLGLRIVRAKTHEPVASWRYVLRYLAYIPSTAPLMLGILWMAFNKERRGWHDYIAGTVVLNMRPEGWYWDKIKQGYYYVKCRLNPSAVEQPVGEPAPEKRHDNGSDPV